MNAKQHAIESLREQQKWSQNAGVSERVAEWKDALKHLFDRLRNWLADAEAEGLVRVNEKEESITEDRLGTYRVTVLELQSPRGGRIVIRPRARDVAGAFGRVDVLVPAGEIKVVRADREDWRIADLSPAGRWVMTPLTEETFWQIIDRSIA